jgi:DNA-binding SARP family transcriptional activator
LSSSNATSRERLVLRLFGPPRIELDGEPVILRRRKALALLAYLAVTGQGHRRDSLVNLLWPDYDHTRGRAALRRTLFALNQALEGGWLEVDRSEIGLNPAADLQLDVRRFGDRLAGCKAHGHAPTEVCPECEVPLSEAVELARGDFMAGFGLKDSSNFDDWQVFQTEALRRELGDALDRLARWHSSQRQFERAIGYARRRLALDPLDEAAHRQLMRLFAWSGQRSAAVRQYDECVAVLEDQLGLPPQEATTELRCAIEAGQPPPLSPRLIPPVDKGLSVELIGLNAGSRAADGVPGVLPGAPVQTPAFLDEEQPYDRPLFVARERELMQLDALLDRALEGQGLVAFVTGEAGSGKTSLVQEFTRRAQEIHSQLLVATGNCNAYTGIGDPYLPFRDILHLLTGDVQARWAAGAMSGDQARRLWNALPLAAEALARCGPDLIDTFLRRSALLERAATRARGLDGADSIARLNALARLKPPALGLQSPQQSHLFEQYSRVLQALAQKVPLVLVVDDLQWADPGSVSLLFHLGRHLLGSRILLVGAYRPEEVALVTGGASRREAALARAGSTERHPLEPVVNELQRDFGDVAVNIDRAERRGFVEALLDSEPNSLALNFREMLHRQTRGHPLFTVELLRGMQERGDLVRDSEGRWVEGPALDWGTLPARVEAAIAERVGRLSETSRAVLRVASVEGEEFTAEVVARVLGTSDRDLVTRLSSELDRRHRLVRAQSIRRVGSRRVSRYRFRNFLFQKYIYDDLDDVERAYLHEDVGTEVEGLYEDQAPETAAIAPELARHFVEAGLAEKAVRYLLQAGENALHLSAYEDGIAHLSRGLDLLRTLPESPERDEQELHLQLVLGLAWQGPKGAQSPELEGAYTRARELGHRLGRTSQLCQVVGELSNMYFVRAELRRARPMADEALNLARQTGDPLLVALAQWYLGLALFSSGEHSTARTCFDAVIDSYKPKEHHQAYLELRGSDAGLGALAYDACCLWCLGYPEQALRRSDEALGLARELGHPFSLADVVCHAGCTLSQMRRDGQALKDYAEEQIELATHKTPVWLPSAQLYLGAALSMLGQHQAGLEQMLEAMESIRSCGATLYMSEALCCMGKAQARVGRPEEGLATMSEGCAFVEKTGQRHSEPELHRLRAEILHTLGRDAEAEADLRTAIEVAQRQSAKSWELRATTSLARLWQAQGRGQEARPVLADVYNWFTEGFDTRDLQEARALLEELR